MSRALDESVYDTYQSCLSSLPATANGVSPMRELPITPDFSNLKQILDALPFPLGPANPSRAFLRKVAVTSFGSKNIVHQILRKPLKTDAHYRRTGSPTEA